MTKQVQRRRGTATQHTSFTGAEGETSVNTTNKSIHVHDGTTTGGFEAARIDLTNVTGATVAGKVTGSTLSSLTITSADINGGTVDNVAIGNTTPSSGLFTTLNASSTLTLGGTAVTSTAAELNILDGVTATAAELNVLDGVTATAAELNLVDGSAAGSVVINKAVIYSATGQVNATQLAIGGTAITSTAAELNILDGVTSTTAELNILDGVTSTAAELNILDGVTANAAELNILDGVTSTTAELNILDGVTATTAELNFVDGVTSNVQTQINTKAPLASPAFTGGIDVTGTVVADGLTVGGNSNLGSDSNGISGGGHTTTISGKSITDGSGWYGSYGSLLFKSNANYTSDARQYLLTNAENSTDFSIIRSVDATTTPTLGTSGAVTSGRKSLTLASSGDISFYEDTGTTAKFFWDASAESLGIGTSSPSYKADILSTNQYALRLNTTDANGCYLAIQTNGTAKGYLGSSAQLVAGTPSEDDITLRAENNLQFTTGGGTERMRIDSDGNVKLITANDTAGTSKFLTFGTNSFNRAGIKCTNAATYDGSLEFYTGNASNFAERMRIDSSGGLLLGTTSNPNAYRAIFQGKNATTSIGGESVLNLADGDANGDRSNIRFTTSTDGPLAVISANAVTGGSYPSSVGLLEFGVQNGAATTTAMTIDASGNVGIGTSLPNAMLQVQSTLGITTARLEQAGNVGGILIGYGGASANYYDADNHYFRSGNSASNKMTIDSSGNLLVGKSDLSSNTAGTTIWKDGYLNSTVALPTANTSYVARFNRKTTDGPILELQKDGAVVGGIGAFTSGTSALFFGSLDTALLANSGNDSIHPWNASTNTNRDNAIDLGNSGNRFDDIYATNGTIQTSDRNEKQDIDVMSEAETRVAVACKGLIRKFRWIDAVAEKGDDARIHFGIIAQDLQDAFAAEGLDAGRYAMFISSTWWETQTDVPAVEAVAEVLDEEGNVVTEAVEAKEAYTRTDTYETLEEAPEGATERTRLGVRYPELLAFIIGAL
jgi:hypothetical protein